MKLFESPIFWCSVVLIAVGVGVALRVTRRAGDDNPLAKEHEEPHAKEYGFKEVVKDPEGWKENIDATERNLQQMLAESKSWSDEKLSKVVWRFVFEIDNSRNAWVEFCVLQSLRPRVHPVLLRYLADKSMHVRLLKPTEEGVLPETPFKRLCDLLVDDPPAECVALLVTFLDEPSAQIRKEAILVTAVVGAESILMPVRKALSDEDEYVRSYAIIGIQRAIKNKRLSDVCRKELFEDVGKLLSDGKNGGSAVELLLQLDERSATEWLLSDKSLTLDSRCLHYVLQALNERSILVPRERLLFLFGKLQSTESEYPATYQLREVLHAIGKHKVEKDREELGKYLAHKERVVAEGAASGLLASHGLGGFRASIWNTIEKGGIRALTPAQRHYHAVMMLDGEVNNGGLSQFFFNSSGGEWRDALAGLEAMESKERLAIFREALAKFGERGPSTNRDERMTQLAKLAKANDKLFGDLDSRYYASKEVIEVMAMRYVLKHPEAFR
jgi:HEAT repeat protein